MADMLVTQEELETFLQTTMDSATATLLIELATGKVQAIVEQRLIEAEDTEVVDIGDNSQHLWLAEFPVRTVSEVVLDGVAVTDYKLFNQRLWRRCGWLNSYCEPSQALVTYVHGYSVGAQALQLARSVVLGLAAAGYGNPSQIKSEAIDDYRVTYDEALSRMEVPSFARDTLIKTYGRSAYVT